MTEPPPRPSYPQAILLAIAALATLRLAIAIVGAERAGEPSPWGRVVALGVAFSLLGPALATLVAVAHVTVMRVWPPARGVLGSGGVGALLAAAPLTVLLALGVGPEIVGAGIAYTAAAGFVFGAAAARLAARSAPGEVPRPPSNESLKLTNARDSPAALIAPTSRVRSLTLALGGHAPPREAALHHPESR